MLILRYDTNVQANQQCAFIYGEHTAECRRCGDASRLQQQLLTLEQWDGSNVQYNVWPQESSGKLLCPICCDAELILESSSFCLPRGILATGWNTVQSICFSSDAVIASLLCLRDATLSHLNSSDVWKQQAAMMDMFLFLAVMFCLYHMDAHFSAGSSPSHDVGVRVKYPET